MNLIGEISPAEINGFIYTGNPKIRSGSIIYPDVTVGSYFDTGHNVVIRSGFRCGHNVSIGTSAVVDGDVTMGDYVKVSTGCYLPPGVRVGSKVFLAPNVTFTNDGFPLKRREEYQRLETFVGDNVSIGAGAVILPGVSIGNNCFVAAGAVVTKSVAENRLVVGFGKSKLLPPHLVGENWAKSWRHVDV